MKSRSKYSYATLRYVHDTAIAEFVNVGVAIYSPDNSYFKVICRSSLGRVADIFPDIKRSSFRSLMRDISNRYKDISEILASALNFEGEHKSIEALLGSVLPVDDSSLIWSPAGAGLTTDPEKTARELFLRYVSKYDPESKKHKRTDDDIWRNFHKGLEERQISKYFTEKVIASDIDQVKFKSAWKNGVWHCIEPISFDLAAAEGIKDKALRFLGQMTSVADAGEKFKIYLIVGEPSADLSPALDKALAILKKIPVDMEIYREQEEVDLLNTLKTKIQVHDAIVH